MQITSQGYHRGEELKVEEMYKYLSVHLENGLDWRCNCEVSKSRDRAAFTSRERLDGKMLRISSKSAVKGVILT